MRFAVFFILFLGTYLAYAEGNGRTPAYPEIISTYEELVKKSDCAKLVTYGTTDVGKPLHLFIISKSKDFEPETLRKQNKRILLINNGIHPGEPDGIDASIRLAKTLLGDKSKMPDSVVICIIPVYNVDGCLNRNKYSRANQNGPEEHGFRGNARNLDLNRDFIKMDSENAKTFVEIFQEWKPEVFVDTHTSNGADYQYVFTLIATQKDKLEPSIARYMTEEMLPVLQDKMKKCKTEICPYVETRKETPDDGITGFMETPRYATGYAALFNTIGFTTETHMWKPYKDRVEATYQFLLVLIETIQKDAGKIGMLKRDADSRVKTQKEFTLSWELDTLKFDSIAFKGYEAEYRNSAITGHRRLYYNRARPYEKNIPFYNNYLPKIKTTAPAAYIIPQAWKEVIVRLHANGVEMKRLDIDTAIAGEVYYISSFETVKNPFEGHYLHFNIKTRKEKQTLNFYKGDYIVHVNQACNRYIIETLEPEAGDSFFAWNFFDAILQQKEWFSDYIFEEKAEELLKENHGLKEEFEAKKKSDKSFAQSHWAQLVFIYRNSPYYERSHNRYPIMRLNEPVKLPLGK